MRPWMAVITLAVFLSALTVRVSAQETSNASDKIEYLRAELSEVQNKEAELKIRLEQLNFDLKPENIERFFNGVGSTRPEELRESRRRQLQMEKDRILAQLNELASSHTRVEAAITQAQAKAYQQSALGTVIQIDKNVNAFLLSIARVLVGFIVLLVVVGSLVLRVVIRERRHL